jgi:hypothetical protein
LAGATISNADRQIANGSTQNLRIDYGLPSLDVVAKVNRTITWFDFKTLLELNVVAAPTSNSLSAASSF